MSHLKTCFLATIITTLLLPFASFAAGDNTPPTKSVYFRLSNHFIRTLYFRSTQDNDNVVRMLVPGAQPIQSTVLLNNQQPVKYIYFSDSGDPDEVSGDNPHATGGFFKFQLSADGKHIDIHGYMASQLAFSWTNEDPAIITICTDQEFKAHNGQCPI